MALLAWIAATGWLLLKQRYLALALSWFLIPAAWRLVSSLYIDHFGPVYAPELFREIGPGQATGLLLWHYLVALISLAVVLRRSGVIAAPAGAVCAFFTGRRGRRLVDVAFVFGCAFVAALYLDMIRLGPIPLFEGIERLDYARDYAGVFDKVLNRWGPVWAVCLGFLFVAPRRWAGAVDRRFLYLLIAVFGYAFLAGHRYSMFFKFSVLFVMPVAVLALEKAQRASEVGADTRRGAAAVMILVAATSTLVVSAVLWSYFVTRFPESNLAFERLTERLLVEQAELWFLTFERVVEQGRLFTGEALERLFNDPIDPDRNTTITYLMWLAIGEDAQRVLSQGQQYTGGFPEVFVELFGPQGSLGATLVVTLVVALMIRIMLLSVSALKPMTLGCAAYLFYGFAILYWGGMVNFLLTWTFWGKCAALAAAWTVETVLPSRGVSVVPWAPSGAVVRAGLDGSRRGLVDMGDRC